MKKKNDTDITLGDPNQFEKKKKNDTDITQKDKTQIKTPPCNSCEGSSEVRFYRRFRHIS